MTLADALVAELTDAQLAQLAERLRPHLADRDADTLLTPTDAAARLGVHPKTLTRAAKDGRVPGARRVGAAWRFDPKTLDLTPPRPPSTPPASAPRRARRKAASTTADAIRNPSGTSRGDSRS